MTANTVDCSDGRGPRNHLISDLIHFTFSAERWTG
jgi:hypothetical protein